MRKVCFFTGTRAEYGLLKPLLKQFSADSEILLQLIVSGMHLSPEFGSTHTEIENDGFVIDEKVEILVSSDSDVGICKTVGLGLIGFSESLKRLSPDILVLLGDRFEAFAAAAAAMICRIPIAHIHGGEATYGLIDEPIRHSITKMSHLHFTSTEDYRNRVVQLGEDPERVFNVGALGVENINNLQLLTREELETTIQFSLDGNYIVATYHPVTLEKHTSENQFSCFLEALDTFPDMKIIFTKANSDTDGRIINTMIDRYVTDHPNRAIAFSSMGSLSYLSAIKYASAVVGNSSSGLIEAPSFNMPTVNIGDRQKGRLCADSVINCQPETILIKNAMAKAFSKDFIDKLQGLTNPYAKKNTSLTIKKVIKGFDLVDVLKKDFYDIPISLKK